MHLRSGNQRSWWLFLERQRERILVIIEGCTIGGATPGASTKVEGPVRLRAMTLVDGRIAGSYD